MKTKILIGGGSGMVGTRLREQLDREKWDVRILSRSIEKKSSEFLEWDLSTGKMDLQGFKPDVIVNLAGAGVADKLWTKARKKVIIESRVDSNHILVQAILNKEIQPKVFLSASAIGIYGDRGDEKLTTNSKLGDPQKFMVECCTLWEQSIDSLKGKIDRIVKLRIGLVLSNKGGALPKIMMPMNFGIAPYFGNGKQYYAWIHIDDLVSQIIHLISTETLSGVFNGVSTEPLTLKEFTRRTKAAKGKIGLMFPIPAFALKLFMGEMSNVLLNSSRVYPDRLLANGFQFRYTKLVDAIKDIIERGV